jgi:nicotinamidase/pyrazinamidase
MGKLALLVIDVQLDFCPGGALAVEKGDEVAAAIAADLLGQEAGYDYKVATRDMHVAPGDHFSEMPDFVDSWPIHCLAGTPGAELHEALDSVRTEFDAIFDKGAYHAAYSGFEGAAPSGSTLGPWLSARDVDRVDLVGLATDYCVRATALDAAELGLAVRVLLGYTAGVATSTTLSAIDRLRTAGVEIVGPTTANGITWAASMDKEA